MSNRALAERLRLLEMAVTHARDAIVITEAEPVSLPGPRILYVNSAFTAKTGYSPDEVVGKSPRILQGPKTDPAAIEKIRAALRAWEPIEIEILNYRKDGSTFWSEISIVPVADETGYFTNWMSVQRDLTDRKALHEALTQSRVAQAEAVTLAVEAQQRKRIEEQLALSITHDDLTGLRNRKYFMRGLQLAVARSSIERGPGTSLLSVNIDRFKSVNASFGNRLGDEILRNVAIRLKRNARPIDILGRMAGDEYAIVLPGSDAAEALKIAQRIKDSLQEPLDLGEHKVKVSLSIGLTSFANGLRDPETLLRDSATAMRRATRDGGDRVVVFTDAMEADVSQALRVHSELRGAVEREELCVHYQPIVDVANRRVSGFEALLRWQHPTRGLLGPLHFIPQAEEAGLLGPIGAWVLERACTMAAGWQVLGDHPLSISVNVTSQQLLEERFVENLVEILGRTKLSPKLLQLEVTESVLLAGASVIGPLFASIRALGVKIAFDDFGTGYSSLSYLERFQIDTLKIDQSFVARLADASAKSEIVRMMIALAHSLGVKVVAEGVELRAQRDTLYELGCTEMQGYLFSRPVPEERIAGRIESRWHDEEELRELVAGRSMGFQYEVLSESQRAELLQQVRGAIAIHHAWLARLRAAVESGRSDYAVADVARDSACAVGVWLLETIDPKLRTSPLYVITKARHAVFHRSAARLLALAMAKDPAARTSLEAGGDFHMVASLMLSALEDWLALAERAGVAEGTLPGGLGV